MECWHEYGNSNALDWSTKRALNSCVVWIVQVIFCCSPQRCEGICKNDQKKKKWVLLYLTITITWQGRGREEQGKEGTISYWAATCIVLWAAAHICYVIYLTIFLPILKTKAQWLSTHSYQYRNLSLSGSKLLFFPLLTEKPCLFYFPKT